MFWPSQSIVNIKDFISKSDLFGTEIGSDDGMCCTMFAKGFAFCI